MRRAGKRGRLNGRLELRLNAAIGDGFFDVAGNSPERIFEGTVPNGSRRRSNAQ